MNANATACRWTLRRSVGKRPWVVEDTASPRYEDARIYLFATRRRAMSFIAMLAAEAAA